MWHGAHSAKGELSFIVMGYCQVGGGWWWLIHVCLAGGRKAITLPVLWGEMDNLASSTATGLHKGEHMGRMRMEAHEYCADVGGGSGEEKSVHMVF